MKTGQSSAHEFETACSAHGFEETRSVSRVSAGRQGDDYFVVHAGRRQFLNRHLKKEPPKTRETAFRSTSFGISRMTQSSSVPCQNTLAPQPLRSKVTNPSFPIHSPSLV